MKEILIEYSMGKESSNISGFVTNRHPWYMHVTCLKEGWYRVKFKLEYNNVE